MEKVANVAAAGFLTRYLSGPLPYVCHLAISRSSQCAKRGITKGAVCISCLRNGAYKTNPFGLIYHGGPIELFLVPASVP